MTQAFAGIDVACAKRKRLPIVIARWHEGRLLPERLAEVAFSDPPDDVIWVPRVAAHAESGR